MQQDGPQTLSGRAGVLVRVQSRAVLAPVNGTPHQHHRRRSGSDTAFHAPGLAPKGLTSMRKKLGRRSEPYISIKYLIAPHTYSHIGRKGLPSPCMPHRTTRWKPASLEGTRCGAQWAPQPSWQPRLWTNQDAIRDLIFHQLPCFRKL